MFCKRELIISKTTISIRGKEIKKSWLKKAEVIRVESENIGIIKPVRILKLRYNEASTDRWIKFQRAMNRMNLKKNGVDERKVYGERIFTIRLN